MQILLSNDKGDHAPGVQVLTGVLRGFAAARHVGFVAHLAQEKLAVWPEDAGVNRV